MAVCFLQATKANTWSIETLSPKQVHVRTIINAPQPLLPNQYIEATPITYTRETQAVFYHTTQHYDRITFHMPLVYTERDAEVATVTKYSVYVNTRLVLELDNVSQHHTRHDEFEVNLGQVSKGTEIDVHICTQGLVDRGNFGSKDVLLIIPLDHAKINPLVTKFNLKSEYTGSAVFWQPSHGYARVTPQGTVEALAEGWELRWQKEYVLRLMPAL
jgi:hypothetical protein